MAEEWKEVNSEEKLKLLQNIKDGSLVFERICTFTHNIKGDVGHPEQSIECSMLGVRVGMSQGEQNVQYNLKILQYDIVIVDLINPVLKDQINTASDNTSVTKDSCKKNQVRIRYEAFAKSLNKEFLTHMKTNWKWQESELLETMRCVLAAVEALHKNNLVHGDIRMNSIVLTEDGSVKLADQFCSNFDNIQYSPSAVIKNDDLLTVSGGLLSPEILQALHDQKLQKKQGSQNLPSQQKSILTPECDLWALGVILLEMGLLENVHSHIYDYHNYSIKLNVLGQKMTKLKKQLTSKSLVWQLVEMLLSKDPKVRRNAYGFMPLQVGLRQQSMAKQKKRMQNDRYVGKQGMVPSEQVILESDEIEEQEISDVSLRDVMAQKVTIQEDEEYTDERVESRNKLEQNQSLRGDTSSVVVTPVFGIPGNDMQIIQDDHLEDVKEKELIHENNTDNSHNPLTEDEQTTVEHSEQNQVLISSLENMFLDEPVEIEQPQEQLRFQQQTTFVSTQPNESKEQNHKLKQSEILPDIVYSSSYDYIPIPVLEEFQVENQQNQLDSQNKSEILQEPLEAHKASSIPLFVDAPQHKLHGNQILLLKPSQTIFQQKSTKTVTPFEAFQQHSHAKQSPTNSTAPSIAESEESKEQQKELFISPSVAIAPGLEIKSIISSSAKTIRRKPYCLALQGGEEEQDENIDTSNINKNVVNNKLVFPSPSVQSKSNGIKTQNTNQQLPFYFPSKASPQPGIYLLKPSNSSNTKHKLHHLSTDNTSSNSITNISNQHGALTEVFNSISPIRDSHSKLLLNRSSINEWMHESTNSTASQHSNTAPSNFTTNPIRKTIDEKLAHLDRVCEDALRKSVENRTMIEEMMKKREITQIKVESNLTSMTSSNSPTHSSSSFERFSCQKNSCSFIKNSANINTSNLNKSNSKNSSGRKDLKNNKNCNLNCQESKHNSSRCSDYSDLKKSLDCKQAAACALSAEENLKLSAHFGSLALSHLVSYIHSNSSKNNQPFKQLSQTLNDCSCRNQIDTNSSYTSSLSSSGQFQNQQQLINEKLLKALFESEQDIQPIQNLMQSSYAQQSAFQNNS